MSKPKNILVLQGHPDTTTTHLCHALADAYSDGAQDAGHSVARVTVADLDFPVLRSPADWTKGPTPDGLTQVQQQILAADHLVIIFPLWLGSLPALLKAFFEQIFRPNLMPEGNDPVAWRKLMKGCSVRLVVTLGMPAFAYRLFFRAHGVKFFIRNVLAFSGCGPIRTSYFGMTDKASAAKKQGWFAKLRRLGTAAR
ncbi:NAD(P)H-dependent oxidoreductase [Kordiimonas lacus]|uniref:Putative NADPH-quinone reductase (Modulator of drug activity B) n=1 Tax=Kordiimonas lacus TaxID=637679 RepID=A0A1G6XUK4_9PROT|nr:NAD(P)H-dependent oxidoreductase [Kordiimonas lacus]SDD81702.1 Putative NADPH-quinone reductase (modulator of drug activity B) [Kordiimonas lacus]